MGDSCLTTTECNKISYAHSIQSHVSSHNYSAKNRYFTELKCKTIICLLTIFHKPKKSGIVY